MYLQHLANIYSLNRCEKFVVLSEHVYCILYANEINMKTLGIKMKKMQELTILDLIDVEKLYSCVQNNSYADSLWGFSIKM